MDKETLARAINLGNQAADGLAAFPEYQVGSLLREWHGLVLGDNRVAAARRDLLDHGYGFMLDGPLATLAKQGDFDSVHAIEVAQRDATSWLNSSTGSENTNNMHEEELLNAVSQGLQFNDEFSLLPGNRFLQHSLVGIHQFESGDYSEAIENFDSALAASHFGSRFYWIEAFRHFASSEV